MNPSSTGWIKKLLNDIAENKIFFAQKEPVFYDALRSCGFIYGNNLEVVSQAVPKKDFSEEELSKVNFCLALYYIYTNGNCNVSFTESVIGFYDQIESTKTSFFRNLLGDKPSSEQLENILHKRIQIDANVLTKNFRYFIINALLFVDVLAYKKYIKNLNISVDYLKTIESSIATISLDVLISKETKNEYDESLIKLFESSLRYLDNRCSNYNKAVGVLTEKLEKFYILDLACMASWSDKIIDSHEEHFLEKLGQDLNLKPSITHKSIEKVNHFYTLNQDKIALLSSKNLVKSFYDNSSKMVYKLITRNSKRLYKELLDSKELMVLLSQSTIRDLDKEEQKKVQDHLLDIFKSIPSLAIFMLPGGALLLPLVVKFIPKLLPSAFDENRIDD